MLAERADLRVQFRVEPIRPGDRGLEVVDDDNAGHPPNDQKAFSRQARRSSVVWRNTASL